MALRPWGAGLALVCGLGLLLALLASCADDQPRKKSSAAAPVRPTWQVSGFDDLPLPELATYEPEPGTVPFAASFAGGDLRRFDVHFVPRAVLGTEALEQPQAALDRLASSLAALGWARQPTDTTDTALDARFNRPGPRNERVILKVRSGGGGSRIHLILTQAPKIP